ncbi:MAG: AURKAIP1/COX24 domain-containing protein [Lentisphaerae bacterium]|nr:AURKAIP1/COX24 domain-containing protein [Lentisphaerota bacterium]
MPGARADSRAARGGRPGHHRAADQQDHSLASARADAADQHRSGRTHVGSIKKKRRAKMSKHKHDKRLKANRHKN